jgi:hypothetical protein
LPDSTHLTDGTQAGVVAALVSDVAGCRATQLPDTRIVANARAERMANPASPRGKPVTHRPTVLAPLTTVGRALFARWARVTMRAKYIVGWDARSRTGILFTIRKAPALVEASSSGEAARSVGTCHPTSAVCCIGAEAVAIAGRVHARWTSLGVDRLAHSAKRDQSERAPPKPIHIHRLFPGE